MTTEQAMKIIEEATANLQANRQTHAMIAQAIKVLRDELASNSKKTTPKKDS